MLIGQVVFLLERGHRHTDSHRYHWSLYSTLYLCCLRLWQFLRIAHIWWVIITIYLLTYLKLAGFLNRALLTTKNASKWIRFWDNFFNATRNLSSHIDLHTHTSSTFDLDLLTFESIHTERLPCTLSMSSLVLIVQVAYLLERGHSDTQSRRCHWSSWSKKVQ